MPSPTSLTRCLLLGASLALVPSCGPSVSIQPLYPNASDLQVQPKPQLRVEDLNSDAALDAHDRAIEVWGTTGWLQVARICRYFAGQGMPDIVCPPAD